MSDPERLLHERYRLGQMIGRGGFSTVYLAADTRLAERPVAIKVLDLAQMAPADRAWVRDQLAEEARLLGQLRHPGIVDVYDFFAEGERAYLVMEYVPGRTLHAYLDEQPGRRLPPAETLAIATELAAILEHLHQWQERGETAPIIYRDLKPANIILREDGTVKLLDFGIARTFKAGQGEDTHRLGTPGYAAPEQYGEGQSDPRSDVYSLGVLLHELLSGHDPADNPFNLPPLAAGPPVLSAVVAQATALQPAGRFQNMAAFRRALQRAQAEAAPGNARAGGTSRAGKRAPWAWLGAAGLLALIPIFFWLNGALAGPDPTPSPTPETVVLVQTATSAPATASATATATPTGPPTVTATPSPTPAPSATPTPTPSPTATRPPGPYFADAYFCLTPCLPDGSNSRDTFPAGVTEIHTRWRYEDIPTNARYERIWTSNGQEYVRYDCRWPGPASGVDDDVVLMHTRGLRAGTWELTIRVDGETLLQEQLALEGNHDYWRPVGTFTRCYGSR